MSELDESFSFNALNGAQYRRQLFSVGFVHKIKLFNQVNKYPTNSVYGRMMNAMILFNVVDTGLKKASPITVDAIACKNKTTTIDKEV